MFSLSVWLPFIWKRKRTIHLWKLQELTRPTNIQADSLNPGQTIETFQRDLSQHCRAQHVARVWSRCCDVLQHIQCCKPNYCTYPGAKLLHKPGQSSATSCHIQKSCMNSLTILKLGQHPTCHNRVAARAQQVPPTMFRCCVVMLRLFGLVAFSEECTET